MYFFTNLTCHLWSASCNVVFIQRIYILLCILANLYLYIFFWWLRPFVVITYIIIVIPKLCPHDCKINDHYNTFVFLRTIWATIQFMFMVSFMYLDTNPINIRYHYYNDGSSWFPKDLWWRAVIIYGANISQMMSRMV